MEDKKLVRKFYIKTAIISIVTTLSVIGIVLLGEIIFKNIENQKKEQELKQIEEKRNRIFGTWNLVDDEAPSDLNVDKQLTINKENYIEGTYGVNCFENNTRKTNCEFVQQLNIDDDIKIQYQEDNKVIYLCFYIDNDYLIEKECSNLNIENFRNNYNIKYKKN